MVAHLLDFHTAAPQVDSRVTGQMTADYKDENCLQMTSPNLLLTATLSVMQWR